MLIKKNYVFACLAGVSAAAVAVLSVGGYILHKKIVKYRLREFARLHGMNLAMFDMNGGKYNRYEDDYDDYVDDDGGEDDYDGLFDDLDTDGFDNLVNEIRQGDGEK